MSNKTPVRAVRARLKSVHRDAVDRARADLAAITETQRAEVRRLAAELDAARHRLDEVRAKAFAACTQAILDADNALVAGLGALEHSDEYVTTTSPDA